VVAQVAEHGVAGPPGDLMKFLLIEPAGFLGRVGARREADQAAGQGAVAVHGAGPRHAEAEDRVGHGVETIDAVLGLLHRLREVVLGIEAGGDEDGGRHVHARLEVLQGPDHQARAGRDADQVDGRAGADAFECLDASGELSGLLAVGLDAGLVLEYPAARPAEELDRPADAGLLEAVADAVAFAHHAARTAQDIDPAVLEPVGVGARALGAAADRGEGNRQQQPSGSCFAAQRCYAE